MRLGRSGSADSPENNAMLERVRRLLGGERVDEAPQLANELIDRSPRFAEAYNQRAIALFSQGRFEDSAADCRRVLAQSVPHWRACGAG